jgi:predicted type IV restriction endonuclease
MDDATQSSEPTIALEAAVATAPAAPVTPAPAAPAAPKTAKWELDERERVKVGIRKFAKPLADFIARDVNEADTRFLITNFLCEVLGYDNYADLTAEFATRGDFADYGLRIDKQLVALIEVKRVTTKLAQRHLRQVEQYGANEGLEWLMLTNGAQWQVYHLDASLPLTVELVFEVDLLGPEPPAKKADRLFAITREGMKHRVIDEVWKAKRATSPKAIARVLTSEAVVTAVRKELRRETDYSATDIEVQALIRATVRPDCLQ